MYSDESKFLGLLIPSPHGLTPGLGPWASTMMSFDAMLAKFPGTLEAKRPRGVYVNVIAGTRATRRATVASLCAKGNPYAHAHNHRT